MRKATPLIGRFLLIALTAGCSTLPKGSSRLAYAPLEVQALEPFYIDASSIVDTFLDECANLDARTPAAARSMCRTAFGDEDKNTVKVNESGLLIGLRKDADLNADLAKPSADQINQTIPLTEKMRGFRSAYLKYFAPTFQGREALIRSFEASFRMRSLLTEKRLAAGTADTRQYDLVIVGAGVHGIIALHEVLKRKPDAKILIIDDGDTAGATFRYGKDFFNINSSNRASDGNSKPLPGQGNLNELPGLPIQVSDMTAVKYPSANDLGSAIVTGLYAAIKEHPNVEVVFNAKASDLGRADVGGSQDGSTLTVTLQNGTAVRVTEKVAFVTTGLGKPSIPTTLENLLVRTKELETQVSPDKLPRVVTFEDLVRIVSQSNNPRAFFANKRIAVAGVGDSANVVLEYILGLATKEAYANSTAQDGRPEKVYWIGQSLTTCKDFIAKARSRYIQIGKGFETSDPGFEALLEANPERLTTVATRPDGTINALLANNSSLTDLDFVILATGSEPGVRSVFGATREFNPNSFGTDSNFLANPVAFNEVNAQTTVSKGQRTKVALKSTTSAIYVLGTATGNLTRPAELVGVIQNSVSIFNNAPRVVSAAGLAASNLTLSAKKSVSKMLPLNEVEDTQIARVTVSASARVMPGQTLGYLKSVFQESLLYVQNVSDRPLSLTIGLNANGVMVVEGQSQHDLTNLMDLLAQTREFFSLAQEVLRRSPGKKLVLEASSNSGRFRAAQAELKLKPAGQVTARTDFDLDVTNQKVPLRGVTSGGGQTPVRVNIKKAPKVVVQPTFAAEPANGAAASPGFTKLQPGQRVDLASVVGQSYNLDLNAADLVFDYGNTLSPAVYSPAAGQTFIGYRFNPSTTVLSIVQSNGIVTDYVTTEPFRLAGIIQGEYDLAFKGPGSKDSYLSVTTGGRSVDIEVNRDYVLFRSSPNVSNIAFNQVTSFRYVPAREALQITLANGNKLEIVKPSGFSKLNDFKLVNEFESY